MKQTNQKIIIGIDPGYAITGYGILGINESRYTVLDYGVITTKSSELFVNRLNTLYTEINQLIKQYKPTIAAIESLFFAKNTKTAIDVAQARGVILLALSKNNLPVSEYTPLQVKQATASYGRAQKNQIQKMVQLLLNLDSPPQPDDAADALAIAWLGSQN